MLVTEHTRPSQTVEDYLQLIYTMRRENQKVIAARMKERLGVSAPTAFATLRRMERDGLVDLHRGREIELTRQGTEAAESIIRRHMLAERLLVDILKLDWADAHDEAHRIEHAISPLVEAQLLEVLARPATCPHGNPIPGLHGPLPETRPLSGVVTGESVVINNISEHAEEDNGLMRYLQRSGLVPDTELLVEEVALPNATLTVCLNGSERRVTVGMAAAQVIQVRTPS